MRSTRITALGLITVLLMSSSLADAQVKANAKTPVVATVTQKSDFADEIEALGTLKANQSVDLTSNSFQRQSTG